jgi:hypothetical protein
VAAKLEEVVLDSHMLNSGIKNAKALSADGH